MDERRDENVLAKSCESDKKVTDQVRGATQSWLPSHSLQFLTTVFSKYCERNSVNNFQKKGDMSANYGVLAPFLLSRKV